MAVSKLERGIQILKVRQAMLKAGIPMSLWPSLPKYNTTKRTTRNANNTNRLANNNNTNRRANNNNNNRRTPNPYAPKYTWAPWGTKGVVHDNCYDYALGSYSNKRTEKSVMGMAGNKPLPPTNNMKFTTCAGIAKRVLADNPDTVKQLKNPDAKAPPGWYKVMCFVAPTNDFGNSTGDFHWYKEISAIRYRTRPGDKVSALAKFFHVTPSVIQTALAKATNGANKNDGRVANDDNELRVLNAMTMRNQGDTLPAGKVLDFPVALWSHKTGWAGGPLIVDASGKTITDPRKADRNYTPGFHYTKFCSAYIVKRGMAKTGNNANRLGLVQANQGLSRLLGGLR